MLDKSGRAWVLLALTAPIYFTWAFVAQKLWTWLIVPLGVLPIGRIHALGLMLFVGMFARLEFEPPNEDAPTGNARFPGFDLTVPSLARAGHRVGAAAPMSVDPNAAYDHTYPDAPWLLANLEEAFCSRCGGRLPLRPQPLPQLPEVDIREALAAWVEYHRCCSVNKKGKVFNTWKG